MKMPALVTRRLIGLGAPALLRGGYYDRILRRHKSQALILVYHGLLDPVWPDQAVGLGHSLNAASAFAAQMEFLRQRMRPISLNELADCLGTGRRLPPNAVAVTFDDGYADNYANAYPTLKRLGIPATIFLTTGFIGADRLFWWDRLALLLAHAPAGVVRVPPPQPAGGDGALRIDLRTPRTRRSACAELTGRLKSLRPSHIEPYIERLERHFGDACRVAPAHHMLNWEQVSEMQRGGIEFGAHTVTHPDLAKIPIQDARMEIAQSKETIERRLGVDVRAFAYPYGLRSNLHAELGSVARDLGFTSCCTSEPGAVFSDTSRWFLPRVSLSDQPLATSLWKLCRHLSRRANLPLR